MQFVTILATYVSRSKAVLLLWIFYVFVLSCVCYVFVRVCLYVLCCHLLGKGWPLGSRLWCLLWVCHFPIGILGQVWYLIVSIPDLCTLTYSDCRLRVHKLDTASSNTIVEIDHEIVSSVILLHLAQIIEEGLLPVTSESICMKYWLGKSVVRFTERPAMTIAVELGHRATKNNYNP